MGTESPQEMGMENAHLFLALSNDLLCTLDCSGRVLWVNDVIVRFTGVDKQDLLRQSVVDFMHPDDRALFAGSLQSTSNAISVEDIVTRLRHSNGSYQHIVWKMQRDGEGTVYVAGRDVSDRRLHENALKSSDERQAFVLSLSDTLRPIADPEETQTLAAGLVGKYLGLDRCGYGEIDDSGEFITILNDYCEPGIIPLSGRIRLGDFSQGIIDVVRGGETLVIDDIASDPRLNDPTAAAAFAAIQVAAVIVVPLIKAGSFVAVMYAHQSRARDWTSSEIALMEEVAERTWSAIERSRAETALRDSRKRLQLALDASGMGAFIWYPDSDLGEPDARLLELFGLPPDGSISLATAIADLIHPEDRERYRQAVENALDPAGSGLLEIDIRVVHSDHSLRWLTIYGQVSFDGEPPQAVRTAGMAIDITERKRAVEERERALLSAERAVQARDEFLSIASHELRNPLANIRGNVQLMRRALARGRLDEPRLERYTATINEASERLTLLINDLLDVTRLQSGQWRMRRQPVQLAGLVRDALNNEQISRMKHRLDIELEDGHPLQLDPERINQVVVNLVDNAFKYSPDLDPVRIVLTQAEGGALLRVIDQGIGLPAEALQSIFEPFGRASNAVTSTIPGLGLGLYICRKIAQAHGGRLWAESEGVGQGTSMNLWLPG